MPQTHTRTNRYKCKIYNTPLFELLVKNALTVATAINMFSY